MNSIQHTTDGAFMYSTATASSLKDQTSLREVLEKHVREGFKTSAYWGVTGETPPREPDDVVRRNTFRFSSELGRKLVPFPKEETSIPRALDYTLKGLHMTAKPDGSFLDPDKPMNDMQWQKLKEGNANVGNRLDEFKLKPRFLNTVSTAHRVPSHFNTEVMKALHECQKKEDELQQELAKLKKEPCVSSQPDGYRLTSEDFCDMSKIDPSSYRVMEKNDDDPSRKSEVYRSRYNNVEREGPRRREQASRILQRSQNINQEELRNTLVNTTKSTLPFGYAPYSAKEWLSTAHREHAPYDPKKALEMNDSNATEPVRNTNYGLSQECMNTYLQQQERFTSRHNGVYATEYAHNYQDRFDQSKVSTDYARKSVFDIRNGVYTINHVYHHPRSDVGTSETYTPAELVPGQYTTVAKEPLHARNIVNKGKS